MRAPCRLLPLSARLASLLCVSARQRVRRAQPVPVIKSQRLVHRVQSARIAVAVVGVGAVAFAVVAVTRS